MERFQDKIAVVTGGASGIGRALCEELARRGTMVTVADINMDGAQRVASAIVEDGGRAEAVQVDVAKEGQVRKLVEGTVSLQGRLDYMFNNAGIGMGGEVRDMDLDDWRRIVDINLWGVIYGTTMAYRVMLEQGHGHIINTASAAGLIPSPTATAYSTTKHAVVGLSASLRIEARELGVKVSVVCPGFIDTGIFEAGIFLNVEREDALAGLSSVTMMDPADCARIILRGVEGNKGIIIVTSFARYVWFLQRLHPSLLSRLQRRMLTDFRKVRRDG